MLDATDREALQARVETLEAENESLRVALRAEKDLWRAELHRRAGEIVGQLWRSVDYDRDHVTGIYFLLQGGAVIYVGQALNVYRRIAHHDDKPYDEARFLPCGADQLNDWEGFFIRLLEPALNGRVGKNGALAAPPSNLWRRSFTLKR